MNESSGCKSWEANKCWNCFWSSIDVSPDESLYEDSKIFTEFENSLSNTNTKVSPAKFENSVSENSKPSTSDNYSSLNSAAKSSDNE